MYENRDFHDHSNAQKSSKRHERSAHMRRLKIWEGRTQSQNVSLGQRRILVKQQLNYTNHIHTSTCTCMPGVRDKSYHFGTWEIQGASWYNTLWLPPYAPHDSMGLWNHSVSSRPASLLTQLEAIEPSKCLHGYRDKVCRIIQTIIKRGTTSTGSL